MALTFSEQARQRLNQPAEQGAGNTALNKVYEVRAGIEGIHKNIDELRANIGLEAAAPAQRVSVAPGASR